MKTALALILMVASPLAFAAINLSDPWQLVVLFVNIVLVAFIFWALWWFIGYMGVPEPFNKLLRVVVGLGALIVTLGILFGKVPLMVTF